MKTHKTNTGVLATIALVLLSALTLGLAFPATAQAWDDCPRGEVDCYYPGACSRYIDTNGDGICDHSQPEPTAATTTSTTLATVMTADTDTSTDSGTTNSGTSTDSDSDEAALASAALATAATSSATTSTTTPSSGSSGGASFLTHYYISPIALGFFLIYAVSFALYKTKRMKVTTHRKIWNVLLLATFLVTGVFGLLLAIQLDYTLPFTIPIDMLFWHVEAGIVMTLLSLFHMGWHFNYYRNLLRTSRSKVRAAQVAERAAAYRAAERRQTAPTSTHWAAESSQVALVPERVQATESRHPAWEARE